MFKINTNKQNPKQLFRIAMRQKIKNEHFNAPLPLLWRFRVTKNQNNLMEFVWRSFPSCSNFLKIDTAGKRVARKFQKRSNEFKQIMRLYCKKNCSLCIPRARRKEFTAPLEENLVKLGGGVEKGTSNNFRKRWNKIFLVFGNRLKSPGWGGGSGVHK